MPDSPRRAAPPWWALASSATGLVALFAGWLVGGALQPAGRYDPVRQTISVLAGHAATDRWVMGGALYVISVGHLVTALGLRGAGRLARVLLAVGGVGGLGLATFAQPRHGANPVHLTCAAVALLALAVFPAVLVDGRAPGRPLLLRPAGRVLGGAVSAALLVWLALALTGPTLGLVERVITAQQTLWPLLAVLALRRAASAAGAASTTREQERTGTRQ